MSPDLVHARAWAQHLQTDPVGGWAAIRGAVLATDPAQCARAAATLRWAVEVECHAHPEVQAATLARIGAELNGRDPGPPLGLEPTSQPPGGAAALVATRAALERQLAALRAALAAHGGPA